MSISIPTDRQIAFLQWQIEEMESAFIGYLNTNMNEHFAARSAFIGRVWGIDVKRNNLILQFANGIAPRLNYGYVGYLNKSVKGVEAENWAFTYKHFRLNYVAASSDITTLFYLKNTDPDHVYIGCRDVDAEFFTAMSVLVNQGKHPFIILAEGDPPVKYLLNLMSFIQKHPLDQVLNLEVSKRIESWHPDTFNTQFPKDEQLLSILKKSNETIVQGPPGTGKSTLVAEVVAKSLADGKAVCITALANKALIEVAEKDALRPWLENGSIRKTNLTANESKILPNLEASRELTIGSGQLLLTTYYKLSSWFDPGNYEALTITEPVYDLLVIEEASQSFLATIAAFKLLAKEVLIVGDPMQLPPIVLNENHAPTIHPLIMKFVYGLETYAANSGKQAFVLLETYRLSYAATKQTGLFYKNRLTSCQKNQAPIKIASPFDTWLPKNQGTSLLFTLLIEEGNLPKNAIELTFRLVEHLRMRNPNLEIAVLAPFRVTVLALQEKIGTVLDDFTGITTETIDRIQGLTTDLTIFLIPLNNPTFALNINRFNVATSRAKSGTIIITDKRYVQFSGIHPLVTQYLDQCEMISDPIP